MSACSFASTNAIQSSGPRAALHSGARGGSARTVGSESRLEPGRAGPRPAVPLRTTGVHLAVHFVTEMMLNAAAKLDTAFEDSQSFHLRWSVPPLRTARGLPRDSRASAPPHGCWPWRA